MDDSEAAPVLRDRFRLEAELGRGSQGVVYRAWDLESQQWVALKTLHDPGAEDAFALKEEFRALSGVRHRNLVRIHDLVVDAAGCFFTMDEVAGVDFNTHVRAPSGPSTELLGRLRDAGLQVFDALEAMHQAGFLHRDIKPSNVRVDERGRVTILDLGLAVGRGGLAKPDQDLMVGSLAYMAPEAAYGAPSEPSSDVYSLAVMLYEAISGHLPFAGSGHDLLHAKHGAPTPLASTSEVPEQLAHAILASLRAAPAERPSLAELRQALVSADSAPAQQPVAAPLIGRDAEVALLSALLDRVRQSGEPAYLEVRGPSGIGKSFLMHQTLGEWHASGKAVVLHGRCLPRAVVPYPGLDGLIDDLCQWLRNQPAPELPAAQQLASLLTIFPLLARVEAVKARAQLATAAEDPGERRREAFAALRALILAIGDRAPIVLAIDDGQWFDADSALFMKGLIAASRGSALTVVISVRTQSDEPEAALEQLRVVAAHNPGGVEGITLTALDDAAVTSLISHVSASALDPARVSQLREEAKGSPWLAVQLARHALHNDASSDVASELIGERITTLDQAARALLVTTCVAYAPLSLELIGIASGNPLPRGAVRQLLAEGYLIQDAPLSDQMKLTPYHARIREAVVGGLSAEQLRDQHRALAEALTGATLPDRDAAPEVRASEANDAFVGRIWHLKQGGLQAEAGQDALRAAEIAQDRMALALAAELFELAIEHASQGPSVWRLRQRLAEVLVLSGRMADAAGSFLGAARDLQQRAPHHPDILSLHNQAAECFLRSGDLKAGGPMLNQCVEQAGLRTPSSQLALFASIAWQRVQIGRRDALRAVPTPGRVPARRRQQMEACWTAMIGLVWVDVILGTHFQLKHSTLALEYGDTQHTVRALAAEACYLAVDVHGSAERSVACISRAQRFAAQADDPQLQAFAAGCAASAAYLRGEFSTSLAASFTADEHVRRCRSRGDWTLADSSLVRMNAHASLGDLNAMRSLAPQLEREAVEAGDRRLESLTLLRDLTPLALDDPDGLRARVSAGHQKWRAAPRSMLHFWRAQSLIRAALYQGQTTLAHHALVMARRTVRDSLLFRMRVVLAEMQFLEGAVALAMALDTQRRTQRALHLVRATRAARALKQVGAPWTDGLSSSLRAAVERHRGRDAEAARILASARLSFLSADFTLHRLVVEQHAEAKPDWPSWVVSPRRLAWSMLPLGAPPG